MSRRPKVPENDDDLPLSHELRDWPATLNLKATGSDIERTISRLSGKRLEMFSDSAFGNWVGVTRIKGTPLLVHKVLLHEIRPDEDLKRRETLRFQFGDKLLHFGPREFCLITGLKFGTWEDVENYPISSSFVQRCFPDLQGAPLRTGDLETLIHSSRFLDISDHDAVTACLLYILHEGFLAKEIRESVTVGWLSLAEDLRRWNK